MRRVNERSATRPASYRHMTLASLTLALILGLVPAAGPFRAHAGLLEEDDGPVEGLHNGDAEELLEGGGSTLLDDAADSLLSTQDEGDGTDGGDQPRIRVRGGGWGHSVGMSQYGARTQAMEGRSYRQVLAHYYRGVDVGTAGGLDPSTEIRVHLFRRRETDTTRVDLEADSRSGGPSTSDIRLRLGGSDAEEVVLDHGETATVRMDAEGPLGVREQPDFLVTLPDGEERRVDADSITVSIDEPAGDNPALLRLPQHSVPEDQRDSEQARLAGTYQWGDVEILHAGDGELAPILELPIERYLRGVAEMPNSWEMEALKAQVLTARTFATIPVQAAPDAVWHVDTTPATQAYAGWAHEGGSGGHRWVGAIAATQASGVGEVVTHTASPRDYARTFYSSSHAGRSENSEDSWAYSQPFPYLRSVDDPWSVDPKSGNPYRSWQEAVPNEQVAQALGDAVDVVAGVSVRSRTEGGSPQTIEVRGFDDGEPVTVTFDGGEAQTNAGAALRNPLELRSQQIRDFGLAPFTDDDGHPLEYNVWAIADRGITGGCDPNDQTRFCPQEAVTRGQMATFLARAKDLEASGEPQFEDVDEDHTHAEGIAAVAEAGIAKGYEDGSYRPGTNVSRAQMATFLTRAFELDGGDTSSGFDDVEGSVHQEGINAVAANDITGGCAEDRYCPDQAVTRAQMAAFLARALGTGW